MRRKKFVYIQVLWVLKSKLVPDVWLPEMTWIDPGGFKTIATKITENMIAAAATTAIKAISSAESPCLLFGADDGTAGGTGK